MGFEECVGKNVKPYFPLQLDPSNVLSSAKRAGTLSIEAWANASAIARCAYQAGLGQHSDVYLRAVDTEQERALAVVRGSNFPVSDKKALAATVRTAFQGLWSWVPEPACGVGAPLYRALYDNVIVPLLGIAKPVRGEWLPRSETIVWPSGPVEEIGRPICS